MNVVRTVIGLALLALLSVGCVNARHETVAAEAPAAIYVMRHLQKGSGDDPSLSGEGAANAKRVSDWFKTDPPTSIYVTATRRAQETAAPLAARLGIAPKIYDPRNNPALVEAVGKEKGTVLIVGHSNTVPDIIAALGGARPAPLTDDDYGDIWKLSGPARSLTRSRLGGD